MKQKTHLIIFGLTGASEVNSKSFLYLIIQPYSDRISLLMFNLTNPERTHISNPGRRDFFRMLDPRVDKHPLIYGQTVYPELVSSNRLDILIMLGSALVAANPVMERRDLFKAASVSPLLLRDNSEILSRIKGVPYQISAGRHRSWPWNQWSVESEVEREPQGPVEIEATGLQEGGPWDKYDALDKLIYGGLARSAYWKPTRVWLTENRDRVLTNDNKSWLGHCRPAVIGSWFGPQVEGDIDVEGVHFSEMERMQIGGMMYGGFWRDPVYTEITLGVVKELQARVARWECVVLNATPEQGRQWYEVMTGVEGENIVTTRFLRWKERFEANQLKKESRHFSQFKSAEVVHYEKPYPGEEGNFQVVNRVIGGLILGIYKIS